MTRLGDAYAALAANPDRLLPNLFIPATKYAQPRCKKCGKELRHVLSMPRTDILPAMQAFRCDACDGTVIWKGELRSPGLSKEAAVASEGDQWITRYVAVSFLHAGDHLAPGPAVECPDASLAVLRAELMTREKDIIGSVAFSRRGNPATGEFDAAVILKTFGEIPEDFDIS
jgi:hypothetical protein